MFGCGTIVMNVKDVDTPVKEVKSIKAPRDVLAQLDKYIDINRDRYRVRGRDMVGGDGGHCHDHDAKEDTCEYCGNVYVIGTCHECPHCGAPLRPHNVETE